MADLIVILIGAVLVNHFVLVRFPSISPIIDPGSQREASLAMLSETTLVLVLSSALAWMAENWLLEPLGLPELRLLTVVLIVAGTAGVVTPLLRRAGPALRSATDAGPSLVMINSAVIAAALLVTRGSTNLPGAVASAAGAGLGFTLLMLTFAELRERLEAAEVPIPLRGAAIALVSAGIMSLAFGGLTGILRD